MTISHWQHGTSFALQDPVPNKIRSEPDVQTASFEVNPLYQHVQQSPFHFLLHLLAAFMFLFAWQIRNDVAPSVVVLVVATIMFLLALSFQTLTVADRDGKQLDIHYGPLNFFGTKIDYREITAVAPGRTSILDGWGIHFIPFRGWTINLWGFECAKIWRGNKVIRIGTDDSENLVKFLQEKISLEARTTDGNT